MESSRESDPETYRTIVLSNGGRHLLLAPTDCSQILPAIAIPRNERVAECLTAALKDHWGQEAVCLFDLDEAAEPKPHNGCHYQVMEAFRAQTEPDPRTKWADIHSLSQEEFADPADYAMVQRALIECTKPSCADRGPFSKLGWFQELEDWTQEAIKRRGFKLTGKFSQLNASPSFALVRFETTGPPVWFKAVGEPNLHEFPITLALENLLPRYVPPVVAVRTQWNGWLALDIEGTSLGETNRLQAWTQAAKTLAELQIESVGHRDMLIAVHTKTLAICALRKLVSSFLSVMEQLMEEQTKVPPPVVSQDEFLFLGEQIEEALAGLEALRLPDTLGNLDLNPGNIIVTNYGCVFLDWAEAYVGNPLFSFQYLVEYFRRSAGVASDGESELIESYASPWEAVVSPMELRTALELAPLVAAFAYATATVAWRDRVKLGDRRIAGYLRSLTRRMHREASYLSDRRKSCTL